MIFDEFGAEIIPHVDITPDEIPVVEDIGGFVRMLLTSADAFEADCFARVQALWPDPSMLIYSTQLADANPLFCWKRLEREFTTDPRGMTDEEKTQLKTRKEAIAAGMQIETGEA